VTLGAVNVEADELSALAQFWSAALGGTVDKSMAEIAFVAAREPYGCAMSFRLRATFGQTGSRNNATLTGTCGTRTSEVARFVWVTAAHRWDVLDEVPDIAPAFSVGYCLHENDGLSDRLFLRSHLAQ
jgi:hypothetical protein